MRQDERGNRQREKGQRWQEKCDRAAELTEPFVKRQRDSKEKDQNGGKDKRVE